MITGLHAPDRGKVTVGGSDVLAMGRHAASRVPQGIGMLFQNKPCSTS
jgi:ABC-type methionine transport system ATPase subunit